MPSAEQIRAVAAKHVDKKTRPNAYEELASDIAALFGMKLEPELFRLSAEKKTGPDIPLRLDSPEFRFYWVKWIALRKRKRLSTAPEALAHHLEQLDECEPKQAIECLKVAINAEHQTIYNQRYRRNVRADQGGFVPNSVESHAKRTTEGHFG